VSALSGWLQEVWPWKSTTGHCAANDVFFTDPMYRPGGHAAIGYRRC
jgi:hypothetical protein